ncbi:MAG TPA: AAA family ATPase, partial [Saprospiraceae bacterium]|nr:AAA family ATPase [Saprospiraceae bacterium]
MIQIRDLHKSFGSLDVLKNIQLDLENKGITAILGPNGSGKT